eukprot:CAMPEP_0174277000 /NCGR_PEP_ID=MMETSP0439-20130205/60691_1 /TAXON_ID=0 /ORGANISM="Stereomyxa ramosa, Strain Chinc5" /LENGTH=306 /DNA_ID=CAMNT_0015369281 /DNA_START=1 /DNA_END=921 /DNA_ORIENTATION=-
MMRNTKLMGNWVLVVVAQMKREREKRKRNNQDPIPTHDSESDDSMEQSSDDEEHKVDGGEIQVEFQFSDIEESDYHVVKRFLEKYLETFWNSGELADLIVNQTMVGTAIKVEGNEESFGFITVVNLHEHQDLQSVKKIMEYLLSKAPTNNVRNQLHDLFKDTTQPLGLILSERMLNIPPQLAPHLHGNLFQELIDAAHDAEAEGRSGDEFKFQNFLMLTNVLTPADKGSQPQKRSKTGMEYFYCKPEDEVYEKHSSLHFKFPVLHNGFTSKWTLEGMMEESKVLLIIPQHKIKTILQEITALCTHA